MPTYIVTGKNTVENTVKKFGYTAARISVPMKWLGKRCEVRLLEEEVEQKPSVPKE